MPKIKNLPLLSTLSGSEYFPVTDGINTYKVPSLFLTKLSGSVSPISAIVPDFIGQEYLDDNGPTWYKATGLTSADWVALN